MAKIKYENWSCEVFPGFYDSVISSEFALDFEQMMAPKGLYLEVHDHQWYANEVCRQWVALIDFDENPAGMRVGRYLGMDSPREYNFRTDRITFEVEVDLNKLKRHCFKDNAVRFARYLGECWQSRDGFWSFIPCTLQDFKDTYRSVPAKRSELVDVMIEFYLLEHVDFDTVERATCERCYEIACQAGIVLTDGRNDFEADFDNDADMYIAGERIA